MNIYAIDSIIFDILSIHSGVFEKFIIILFYVIQIIYAYKKYSKIWSKFHQKSFL